MSDERRRRLRRLWRYLTERRGRPTTMREIEGAMGYTSDDTVDRDLTALEDLGYVRRARGRNGAITVLVPFLSIT